MAKVNIVAIDAWVKPPSFACEHELVQYTDTNVDNVAERVKEAEIIIVSTIRITRQVIEAAPRLRLVAVNGTGTDHIDKDALRERGIWCCRVPAQNVDSVSEHAFALYFALQRKLMPMHAITVDGGIWQKDNMLHLRFGDPPRTCKEETLVLVGYGALGKHIEQMGKALGMRVLVAERKGASDLRPGRTSFQDALKLGTVFILVVPLDESTRDMFGSEELNVMDPSVLIVNVGRGGVVNEEALVEALRAGKIGGAGVDVFGVEPASKATCSLLDSSIPNLILSPHMACTIYKTSAIVKENVEGFMAGRPQNIVVHGKDSV